MPIDFSLIYYLQRDVQEIRQTVNGLFVQVPFYVSMDTVVNDRIWIFELDAIAGGIRDITVHMYLPNHATATFTPSWEKTRPNDLVTFSVEIVPAIAAIVTPAASDYYRYSLGDLPQGLQGRFGLLQDNNAPAVTIDVCVTMLMEV